MASVEFAFAYLADCLRAQTRDPRAGDERHGLTAPIEIFFTSVTRAASWKIRGKSRRRICLSVPAGEKAPNRPEYVEIDYRRGDPVAVNGRQLSPAELLAKVNDLGAKHGIGRVDLVENRYVGMKSRGVYETPGGTILHSAHRALESITMDREVLRLRDALIPRYAEMIYDGYCLRRSVRFCKRPSTPRKRTSAAGFGSSFTRATSSLPDAGPIHRSIFQGGDFEEDDVYNQGDADGFIRLNALRLRLRRLKRVVGRNLKSKIGRDQGWLGAESSGADGLAPEPRIRWRPLPLPSMSMQGFIVMTSPAASLMPRCWRGSGSSRRGTRRKLSAA